MSRRANTKVAYAERRVGASSHTPRWLLKFCAMFFANSFSDRDRNRLNQCERIVSHEADKIAVFQQWERLAVRRIVDLSENCRNDVMPIGSCRLRHLNRDAILVSAIDKENSVAFVAEPIKARN